MKTWIFWNPNPLANRTGDCAVRAVAAALDVDWDTAFDLIAEKAKAMGETMQAMHPRLYDAVMRRFD